MLRPEKNSYKEFDNEKNSCSLKILHPSNFSNGPSLSVRGSQLMRQAITDSATVSGYGWKKTFCTLWLRMEIDGLTRFSNQYSRSWDFFKISCVWVFTARFFARDLLWIFCIIWTPFMFGFIVKSWRHSSIMFQSLLQICVSRSSFYKRAVYPSCFWNHVLGCLLDDNLTWKPHISLLASKLSKSIGIIHKSRFFLSTQSLRTLYNSMILPYLYLYSLGWHL